MLSNDVKGLLSSYRTSIGTFLSFDSDKIFWTNGKKLVLWCQFENCNNEGKWDKALVWQKGALLRNSWKGEQKLTIANQWICDSGLIVPLVVWNKYVFSLSSYEIQMKDIETGDAKIITKKFEYSGYKMMVRNDKLYVLSCSSNHNQVLDLITWTWSKFEFPDHRYGEANFLNGFVYIVGIEKENKPVSKSYGLS